MVMIPPLRFVLVALDLSFDSLQEMENCLWKSYVPAGKTNVIGSLFTPMSYAYLAAVAESESMKEVIHVTPRAATSRQFFYLSKGRSRS